MTSAAAFSVRNLVFGTLVGLLAVALRASLQPLISNELPFGIAFPATVVASVVWGSGAGVMTALVCALAAISPSVAPALPPGHRPLQIGAFLVGSILISMFCGGLAARRPREPEPGGDDAFETPLATWLRAVRWGALLAGATAFVIIAWWGFERAAGDARANVSHACDLAHRHAQRALQVAAEIARRADRAAVGADADVRSREAEVHQRLADMASGLPSVVNLNIWDRSGRPLAGSDRFPVDRDVSIADRAYFREQRAGGQPLGVSEVVIGRQSGRELANATIRRSSEDGLFAGLVAVSLAPSYFRDYYQSLANEQLAGARFALVRVDGTVIARWPSSEGGAQTADDASIQARVGAGELAGSFDLPERRDRPAQTTSFRRLEGVPLYVVVGVNRDVMVASWARFVALLAAILLPTTAGLLYVSWVALRKTRREASTAAELQEQIRRRASAEQSLLESQKLETLAVVTGGVAHDFNNLLAVVSASLHILGRRHPALAREKQMQALTRAIQSGVRLTRQLLSFSRKQALRPETIELQTWLPANEGLLHSTLGPQIRWCLAVDPDTAPVQVDMGELELALINLVVNARHAMPDGGTLTLQVANETGGQATDHAREAAAGTPMVGVAVIDTGVGIPPELLGKVVEPFFTTRARGAGSGLGLSQVQGFCNEAGGSLRIESVVGIGTTVRMNLPAAARAVSPPAPEPTAIATLSGRVLLVEDNEDVGASTETLLRGVGLEVVRTLDADAALRHLETAAEPLDLVYSDITMPGSLDGIEFAFAVKERYPTLPVLLTTGYAEQLDKAIAGGLRVLAKPVAPQDMLTELQRLLVH